MDAEAAGDSIVKVLITGAGGLVGSALLPLFGPDDEVHALVRAPAPALQRRNTRVHVLDLAGPIDTSALPRTLDAVVYLAQSENFRAFPEQARDIFDVNVASLLRLLDHARYVGARTFVIASSGGVHGTSSGPVRDDTAVAATGRHGFYLSTKLCGEILGEAFAPHMDVAMLRLFFAYGRGQRRNMLVPRLVDSVRDGRPVVLQGEQGIRINPIHAADAAAACHAALGLTGCNKVNVAGPEVLSLRELCEMIGDRVERRPIFDVREGSAEADLVADLSAMARLLGVPRRRIADHLNEML